MIAACRYGLVTVLSAGLLCGGPAAAQAPSFDCAKAETVDEKAICADPKLAELDRAGAAAYREARRRDAKKSLEAARAFLAKRRACNDSVECIAREQNAVIEEYRSIGAKVAKPPPPKQVPDWAGPTVAPEAKVKSLDTAAGVPAPPPQAKAGPPPPPTPPEWIAACRVQQKVGDVWVLRVEESFGTIRVQMVYSALDALKLTTRDGKEAKAKVFPYTYSASVTPSGKPGSITTEWLYEQVFVSVDIGAADVDPDLPIHIRVGNSSRTVAPGTPTTLDPAVAGEIGRSVDAIVLSATDHELSFPLDRALFEQATKTMKQLVDEVAAKAVSGACFA
jgi:uncharacterized protein